MCRKKNESQDLFETLPETNWISFLSKQEKRRQIL